MAIPLGTGIDDEIRYTALAESWVAALASSHRNALTRVNLFRKGSAYRHPLVQSGKDGSSEEAAIAAKGAVTHSQNV